eukprot:CAMPEP_0202959204 /NCGR_PEP_ID=MMETSP1396-20130829/3456_1 /ASSEMBLY_ACC=CAM_ASM_000872 /TAXON_ID= /ORGANISM="Pseudokeronopsis sp., Strain Brazil" /LENGTH=154 /DNA_ID=CAMNT_0049677667 /DNA_START=843 /DNA_END=1304 /DNA_ORIENTATION=+
MLPRSSHQLQRRRPQRCPSKFDLVNVGGIVGLECQHFVSCLNEVVQGGEEGLASAVGNEDLRVGVQVAVVPFLEDRRVELSQLIPQNWMAGEEGVLVEAVLAGFVQVFKQEVWGLETGGAVGETQGTVFHYELELLRPQVEHVARLCWQLPCKG